MILWDWLGCQLSLLNRHNKEPAQRKHTGTRLRVDAEPGVQPDHLHTSLKMKPPKEFADERKCYGTNTS